MLFRPSGKFFLRAASKNKIEIRLRFHILPEDTIEPKTSLNKANALKCVKNAYKSSFDFDHIYLIGILAYLIFNYLISIKI